MVAVAALWRHPIKAHGRERVAMARLVAGRTFPWDRIWAVRHDRSRIDPAAPVWGPKADFLNGMKLPALAAITARLDEARAEVVLDHPQAGTLRVRPDDRDDARRLLDWLAVLCPADQPQPDAVVRLEGRGMTDTDWPSVSLLNLASNAAVGRAAGQEIAPERWRGNIWIEGAGEWAERDWIGRSLRIGGAVLAVRQPIKRCRLTEANPATGQRDIDMLKLLGDAFGAPHFGIYAEVVQGGDIRPGDAIEVLP
ncbi:MAG: MOSC domain-containing protein [Rubellimicrobium sp.]|nr:MOSC domain-containing protein [Rubellimicrobium sp.]